MTTEIQAVVDKLVASYGDVKREAKSYTNLNAEEVRDAFLKSTIGTVEHYVLALLHDANPVGTLTATVMKGKKSKAMLVNDVVLPDSVINEGDDANSTAEY